MKYVCVFLAVFCMVGPLFGQSGVTGLLSLDQAITAAAQEVEAKVAAGSEIAVYKIAAPSDELGDFLCENLNDRFTARGKLKPLARASALQAVDTEQQFQMSGYVSDASAVGIGNFMGAKVVVTGTFTRYADFSQLQIRAVDVRTSSLLASYTARINNRDTVLANIAPPGTAAPERVPENALQRLNQGKNLLAEGRYDAAIQEFEAAIAIDRNLVDAYYQRGNAYRDKGDIDRAIADYAQAIRMNPNYANAYNTRGELYRSRNDFERAISDFSEAIRLNPNFALAYLNRGRANRGDLDRAFADFNQALRLNPNYAEAYLGRAYVYYGRRDWDRAIADYTQAIRLNPNYKDAYYQRGRTYAEKGDLDRAIADYTQGIRLNPNDSELYNSRGIAYARKNDMRRAIEDFEAALRIDPYNTAIRQNLDQARRLR